MFWPVMPLTMYIFCKVNVTFIYCMLIPARAFCCGTDSLSMTCNFCNFHNISSFVAFFILLFPLLVAKPKLEMSLLIQVSKWVLKTSAISLVFVISYYMDTNIGANWTHMVSLSMVTTLWFAVRKYCVFVVLFVWLYFHGFLTKQIINNYINNTMKHNRYRFLTLNKLRCIQLKNINISIASCWFILL